MAPTGKPHGERPGGAGGKSIRSGCSDRFGKTQPTSELLRHLLSTDGCSGNDSGTESGVGGAQDFSSGRTGSTASAADSGHLYADADAVGNACAQAHAPQAQEETSKAVSRSRLASQPSVQYSYMHLVCGAFV